VEATKDTGRVVTSISGLFSNPRAGKIDDIFRRLVAGCKAFPKGRRPMESTSSSKASVAKKPPSADAPWGPAKELA
jgi:hypothetical protein